MYSHFSANVLWHWKRPGYYTTSKAAATKVISAAVFTPSSRG